MLNISNFLVDKLRLSFYEQNKIFLGSSNMNLVYNGKNNTDFVFKSFIAIKNKYKLESNLLFESLIRNLDSKYFTCNYTNTLNINLTQKFIEEQIINLIKQPKIIKQSDKKQKILVDFSSPNIAKDMHVGHLRSTIIGDSVCKLLESQGHEILRINHIGDYGLNICMLIEYLLESNIAQDSYNNIDNLQNFYVLSKKKFDSDLDFQKRTYNKVTLLQSKDPTILNAWFYIKNISKTAYDQIYSRLNIQLTEMGESFYEPYIPELIAELRHNNLLENSYRKTNTNKKGYNIENKLKFACINFDNHDESLTIIKSDGGYTYDTTDLAAIKYRLLNLQVDKIYYVVDNGQTLHLELVMETARKIGWLNKQHVQHIGFGLVQDETGKKLRSRNGTTLKLIDLLDEALEKTKQACEERNTHLTDQEKQVTIRNLAYGCIKYADLSTTRTRDYKFSFDKMLSLTGNTAVYQLYNYVRVNNILKNCENYIDQAIANLDNFKLVEPEEINLCKYLLEFPEIIDRISDNFYFHLLCDYLYNLTSLFSKFHKNCRVINYENNQIINIDFNKIIICLALKKVMSECFNILGIELIDKI